MPPNMPICLEGSNLGARHRYLNFLVNDSFKSGDSIEEVLNLPEFSHVDRLYKIDLASKHKHLQFILKNLQDDDMLFFSRALKSKWLLDEEHRQIINPTYLEASLFPCMLTTAVNKMKHWIYINLRDPLRCQEFYQYYLERDPDYAFKFFSKCPVNTILTDFPKKSTMDKITPQRLKVLCEKVSAVAKMFYDISMKDKARSQTVGRNEKKYFDSIKCVMKNDPDIFLDIVEKYFSPMLNNLSADATKYIMTHRKNRCMNKAEFYILHVLKINVMAECLSQEECQHVVTRLARAQYLSEWFSYKNVEPFIKRLDAENKASFKKKIFVDKDIGDMVLECPYDVPKNLRYFPQNHDDDSDINLDVNRDDDINKHIFLYENDSNAMLYDHIGVFFEHYNMEMCPRPLMCAHSCPKMRMIKQKTFLDSLFDEYRYTSFGKTLFELRSKIKSDSSSQNRMYMFLVLVSKSGGQTENLQALFSLMALHKNEPSQVRAAIVRSLVKRVPIWRMPEGIWEQFLVFGHGLGLDGSAPEADCNEGLHAVVIRTLLSNKDCEPAINAAFLKQFSTFREYSLLAAEKVQIKVPLLKMLVKNANVEKDTKDVADILNKSIDVLQEYKIKFTTQPELIAAVKNLINNDTEAAKCLIKRLYSSKLGRKELFKENFEFIQIDSSYVNALKHDVSIISVNKFLKSVTTDKIKCEQFFKKMSIYFLENEDLSKEFLAALKGAEVNKLFARPIAYLNGKELLSYILELDSKDAQHKRFSALVRANAHVARPASVINNLEWKNAGAKMIANKVVSCKLTDIDDVIKNLLISKSTARLATVLAPRTNYAVDIYTAAGKMRPTATLKSALSYIRRQKDDSVAQIWNVVKPLMANIKSIKSSPHLLCNIKNVDAIPPSIQPDYLVEAYKVVAQADYKKSLSLLYRIKNVISKTDPNFIEVVLTQYLENQFIVDKIPTNSYDTFHTIVLLNLNILIKYILFAKTEEIQKGRFERVVLLYLNRLQSYWESKRNKKIFYKYVKTIIASLRNTEVFTNEEYVSSLPVMDKVVQWLRAVIPIERNFELFVPLHLNMLFYKTIRQTAELKPGIFDDVQRYDEAYKIVGDTFGKYIAQEARVLAKTYFESVIVLYSLGLKDFCRSYKNNKWHKVEPYIIKSIVEESNGFECTLGLELYEDLTNKYWMKQSVKEDISNNFKHKDLKEMHYFFEATKSQLYY